VPTQKAGRHSSTVGSHNIGNIKEGVEMRTIKVVGVVFCLSLLFGCAGMGPRPLWTSAPVQATADNSIFSATIKPICTGYGCEAFVLSIQNKTDKNLELDWNKTLYVSGGQTSGGFMFEGVVYKDRNNPKPPDVIFGKGSLTKSIWPSNLVEFSSGKYGGWRNEPMPRGENGTYLTIVVDGKDMHERLTVILSPAPANP
jgi:hypothetical protein